MQTKKRSPFTAIVLAVIIGLLVIALLNGVVRPTQVVVARVPISPGTLLTAETRSNCTRFRPGRNRTTP